MVAKQERDECYNYICRGVIVDWLDLGAGGLSPRHKKREI
jgi:hypothetical protein